MAELTRLDPAGIWKATVKGKELPERLTMYAAAINNVIESEEAGRQPDVTRPPLDLVLRDLLAAVELERRLLDQLRGAAHTHEGLTQ